MHISSIDCIIGFEITTTFFTDAFKNFLFEACGDNCLGQWHVQDVSQDFSHLPSTAQTCPESVSEMPLGPAASYVWILLSAAHILVG